MVQPTVEPEAGSIRAFYRQKSIFITGATGFVGKFLIFRLLQTCDVDKIYILLRDKKGRSFAERFKRYISGEIFTFIPNKKLLDKVIPLKGDITLPFLGLSSTDYETITENVNIVFHSAASIRFTEGLKEATALHVYGTQNVLKLCKKVKSLDLLLHVSSIGAFYPEATLEERILEPPIEPSDLMDKMVTLSDEAIAELSTSLLGKYPKYPNTYTLTKTLAECLLFKEAGDVRVAIVRPPFLFSALREPESGWFDFPQTTTLLAVLYASGMFRTASVDIQVKIDSLPVDMSVNVLIAVAWFVATVRDERFKVFNVTAIRNNPVTFETISRVATELGTIAPSIKQVRPPKGIYTSSPKWVTVYSFVSHNMFAYLVDFVLCSIGKKPILVKITTQMTDALTEIFGKLYKLDIKADIDNIKQLYAADGPISETEREIFYYDVKDIDWPKLFLDNHMRFRRYVLKEPDSNIPEAVNRMKL